MSDNSTIGDHSITENASEITNSGNNYATDTVDQVRRLYSYFIVLFIAGDYFTVRDQYAIVVSKSFNPLPFIGLKTWRITNRTSHRSGKKVKNGPILRFE